MLWFFRPARRGAPTRTHYVLNGVAAFCFTLSFTVNMVYMATEVGLDPLQLVLVGTVLEITCFVFEVPTGIVADLYSRRTSVLIGFALIGAGLLLQTVPLFVAILAAQVIWGVGHTFTSGAAQAWITDEVGEDQVAHVFTREQQVKLAAGLAGTLVAGLLSLLDLVLPMVLSGLGFLALTGWLVRVMPEHHFTPTPIGQRETLRHMAATFRVGIRLSVETRTSALPCVLARAAGVQGGRPPCRQKEVRPSWDTGPRRRPGWWRPSCPGDRC